MANSSDERFSPPSSPKLAARFKAEFNPGENDRVWEKSPCVSFTEEEEEENKPETILQVRERKKWRKAALAVTIASLIVSLILSGASFFASATTDSSSVLASAMDTFLAIFTACIVIWRFRDDENGKIAPKRERQGSIAFGIAFIVDALVAIVVSAKHLMDETKPDGSNIMWPSLLGSCFVYCVLAGMEFWISEKLRSSVLVALCIDDALTGGLLFALAVNQFIQDKLPYLWYLDHSVAIGVSLIILFCGIKILVEIFLYKKLPFQIFS
ncbi:hypothetical protein ACROYT_G002448 [Oculina patagonica]